MESGMIGFVPPTEVTETTKEMQRRLETFGKTIKEMEKTLIRDLTNDYPEHSRFNVSITNGSVQIWSAVDRKSNTRISIKHTN